MTEQEVAQLRFDNENTRIKGKECPNPIRAWSQVGCFLSFAIPSALVI